MTNRTHIDINGINDLTAPQEGTGIRYYDKITRRDSVVKDQMGCDVSDDDDVKSVHNDAFSDAEDRIAEEESQQKQNNISLSDTGKVCPESDFVSSYKNMPVGAFGQIRPQVTERNEVPYDFGNISLGNLKQSRSDLNRANAQSFGSPAPAVSANTYMQNGITGTVHEAYNQTDAFNRRLPSAAEQNKDCSGYYGYTSSGYQKQSYSTLNTSGSALNSNNVPDNNITAHFNSANQSNVMPDNSVGRMVYTVPERTIQQRRSDWTYSTEINRNGKTVRYAKSAQAGRIIIPTQRDLTAGNAAVRKGKDNKSVADNIAKLLKGLQSKAREKGLTDCDGFEETEDVNEIKTPSYEEYWQMRAEERQAVKQFIEEKKRQYYSSYIADQQANKSFTFTFDSMLKDNNNREAIMTAQKFIQFIVSTNFSAILQIFGNPGTGKTTLCQAVLQRFINEAEGAHNNIMRMKLTKNASSPVVLMYDFGKIIREKSFKSNERPEERDIRMRFIDDILNAQLLIIDDFGADSIMSVSMTSYVQGTITEILSERLNKGLSLVIASSLNKTKFNELIGDRACEIIKSYRLAEAVLQGRSRREQLLIQ